MTSAAVTSGPTDTARRTTRAAGSVAAALVALLIWAIAGPVAGVDFTVTSSGRSMEVGAGLVLANALIGSLLGWALLAILERFTSRPRRIWVITALVVMVLSFVMPLNAEASTAARWVLVSLHLAVGAVIIPVFARTSR